MKRFLFIFIIFLSFIRVASAADVSFSAPANTKVGDTFEVFINADTDGELINSIDAVIDYPEDLVSFAGYKEGSTMVRFWIEAPTEKDGKIYLKGIIPGGVLGLYDSHKQELSAVPLARLVFRATTAGNAKISFVSTEILKNDGKGTPLVHDQKDAEITINSVSEKDLKNKIEVTDKIPPEPFDITFAESSIFSKTPSMIIFQASDTDSGIKQYEIKTNTLGWQTAESPFPISKGIFPKNITIRASDFFGNYRDAEISIPGLVPLKYLLVFLTFLLLGIFAFKLLKYKR
jgi:hypothetical protein